MTELILRRLDKLKKKSFKGGVFMDAPRITVKCSVENCHYNKQRLCYADTLEVNAMHGKKNAETSDETRCTTFVEHR
jgi:hypothetical protein